jgi:hypothetical protein
VGFIGMTGTPGIIGMIAVTTYYQKVAIAPCVNSRLPILAQDDLVSI